MEFWNFLSEISGKTQGISLFENAGNPVYCFAAYADQNLIITCYNAGTGTNLTLPMMGPKMRYKLKGLKEGTKYSIQVYSLTAASTRRYKSLQVSTTVLCKDKSGVNFKRHHLPSHGNASRACTCCHRVNKHPEGRILGKFPSSVNNSG